MKPCPYCGGKITNAAVLCRHCHRSLEAQADQAPGEYYCVACGSVANPRTYTKGSFLIEVALWLCFLVPGLLYSLFRLATRYRGCPACGAPGMIPVTSPIAQQALQR